MIETEYLVCILAKRLLEAHPSGIEESTLMDQVWEDLQEAMKQGKLIDVAFRKNSVGRITEVVGELQDWLAKYIISLDDSNGIVFRVNSPGILKDLVDEDKRLKEEAKKEWFQKKFGDWIKDD